MSRRQKIFNLISLVALVFAISANGANPDHETQDTRDANLVGESFTGGVTQEKSAPLSLTLPENYDENFQEFKTLLKPMVDEHGKVLVFADAYGNAGLGGVTLAFQKALFDVYRLFFISPLGQGFCHNILENSMESLLFDMGLALEKLPREMQEELKSYCPLISNDASYTLFLLKGFAKPRSLLLNLYSSKALMSDREKNIMAWTTGVSLRRDHPDNATSIHMTWNEFNFLDFARAVLHENSIYFDRVFETTGMTFEEDSRSIRARVACGGPTYSHPWTECKRISVDFNNFGGGKQSYQGIVFNLDFELPAEINVAFGALRAFKLEDEVYRSLNLRPLLVPVGLTCEEQFYWALYQIKDEVELIRRYPLQYVGGGNDTLLRSALRDGYLQQINAAIEAHQRVGNHEQVRIIKAEVSRILNQELSDKIQWMKSQKIIINETRSISLCEYMATPYYASRHIRFAQGPRPRTPGWGPGDSKDTSIDSVKSMFDIKDKPSGQSQGSSDPFKLKGGRD